MREFERADRDAVVRIFADPYARRFFPDYDNVETVLGMNVTMVTTASTDAEGRALLTHLGLPFRK